MKTAIVTDSNSGITQAEAQKMNVFVLPMPVIIEGQAYYEGIDLLPDQFFRALTERQAVSTSQPSPGDVTALWDKVLAEYEELVYIPMSSGLSASCATAQMLAEDYEGRVFVVDNHRISISQKSSAWDAVALREAGCTVTADSGGIRALCRERLRAVGPVQTAPYPGFPTDAQAVLMAALLLINIPLWIWLIDWVWIPILITVASAVFYLLIVNFYRSPHRNFTGDREDVVVASADGRVVALEEVYEPEYLKCRCIQLSVFMSPTNVHANWFPVDGEVIFYKHHPGRFMAAYLPKSSTENERSTVVIRTLGGQLVLMRQVAGAMARRVVTYARPGDEASIEDHMGFIKLGSRVDLYLPLDTTIKVNLGDKTVGGITEVGRLSHADDKPAN